VSAPIRAWRTCSLGRQGAAGTLFKSVEGCEREEGAGGLVPSATGNWAEDHPRYSRFFSGTRFMGRRTGSPPGLAGKALEGIFRDCTRGGPSTRRAEWGRILPQRQVRPPCGRGDRDTTAAVGRRGWSLRVLQGGTARNPQSAASTGSGHPTSESEERRAARTGRLREDGTVRSVPAILRRRPSPPTVLKAQGPSGGAAACGESSLRLLTVAAVSRGPRRAHTPAQRFV